MADKNMRRGGAPDKLYSIGKSRHIGCLRPLPETPSCWLPDA
jgi:hypothetical protein